MCPLLSLDLLFITFILSVVHFFTSFVVAARKVKHSISYGREFITTDFYSLCADRQQKTRRGFIWKCHRSLNVSVSLVAHGIQKGKRAMTAEDMTYL